MRPISLLRVCTLISATILFSGQTGQASAKDYLSPELRKKVEQLKADVAGKPTTYDNMRARGLIAFDWMNAYAMTGRDFYKYMPVTTAQAGGVAGEAEPKTGAGRPVPHYLDRAIKRLQFADEHPKALGVTTINPQAAPYPAASYQTITVTYSLGDKAMKPGSAIIIARTLMPDNMRFQTKDPQADDYVSVKAANKNVTFVQDEMDVNAEFGSSNTLPKAWMFRIEKGTLSKGERIIITYGDKTGGSKGMKMPTYSNSHIPLPLFVYLPEEKEYFSLPDSNFTVGGTRASGVRGFAPSIVAVGEKFELAIRTQDDFNNRATGAIPVYDLFLNNKLYRSIAAGEAISVLRDVSLSNEGVHRFTIRSKDGSITGDVNPILVEKNPRRRVYWGETHAHSGLAEGMGTSDDLYNFARDDARLDFMSHSEHDIFMDDREWAILRQNVIDFYEPGKFITFLGYEYTLTLKGGGHHNVFFRTPENRNRVPVQTHPMLPDLYPALKKNNKPEDVLIIPHAHTPGDWNLSDASMENLVELMSIHGTFEWFGQYYLDQGHTVGFVAASDDHIAHPGFTNHWYNSDAGGSAQIGGLAAVWANEKSRDGIFDNLKARHTYGTTRQRLILDVSLNGAPMGERIAFSPQRNLTGRIIATSALDQVEIIKNGKVIKTFDYATAGKAEPLPAKTMTIAVSFESPSNPPGGKRALPRPQRLWTGTVKLQGATLKNAEFASQHNPRALRLEKQGSDGVRFKTLTRGMRSTLLLSLANVTPNATVAVEIDASKSEIKTSPIGKAEGIIEMPGESVIADMKELSRGAKTQQVKVGEYTDLITLRRLKDAPVLDVSFSYQDKDAFGQGDSYYVRARQIDEGTAWSSPIWVGEARAK